MTDLIEHDGPAALGDVLWGFAEEWCQTRGAGLWSGVLTLLVALAATLVVGMGWRASGADLGERYAGAGREALAAGDLEAADVCFRKLARLNENDPRAGFGLALAAERKGEPERARQLMERLAPSDGTGFPRAHLWRARDLFERKESLPADALEEVVHHLRHAADGAAHDPEAHAMLGQVYAMLGRVPQAADHLARVVSERPDLRLLLARTYAHQGRREQALLQAQAAADHYSQLVQETPDDVEARLHWADAVLFAEKWDETAAILSEGWNRSRDERFRAAFAALWVTRADVMELSNSGGPAKRFPYLLRAFEAAPESAAVLERLAAFLGQPVSMPAEVLRALTGHLAQAVEHEPENAEARVLLGRAYLAAGARDQAEAEFSRAAARLPEVRLVLARIYAQAGDPHAARRETELARDHFLDRLAADPEEIAARIRAAECQMLLEEWSAAERLLEEGAARSADGRSRAALVLLYAAWFDALARPDADDAGKSPEADRDPLNLLERALALAPESPLVLERLAAWARREDAGGDRARGLLKQLLARGLAVAEVHRILGTNAAFAGNHETAVFHLERADRERPRQPEVLNNLAWALMHAAPPKLERALETIEAALGLAPASAALRETRGAVLLRLGRAREAIEDLEAALATEVGRSRLHGLLAEAYEALGDAELAAAHRRLERPTGAGSEPEAGGED